MSYDRALTVFSPDGRLFQVDYAMEVVKKGTATVGILGKDCVVLGVEKKTVAKLQDEKTLKKIYKLDEHIYASSAGLAADARILMNKARVECQSYRLAMEDPITVELIARYVSGVQQKYTQKGGARPFGIASLFIGIDDSQPKLYMTEPTGTHTAWKANAIGKNSKTIVEFLEKNYKDGMNVDESLTLCIKALLEVVQTGAKNMEIAVMQGKEKAIKFLQESEIEDFVKRIEQEREAAEAEKKRKAEFLASSAGSSA